MPDLSSSFNPTGFCGMSLKSTSHTTAFTLGTSARTIYACQGVLTQFRLSVIAWNIMKQGYIPGYSTPRHYTQAHRQSIVTGYLNVWCGGPNIQDACILLDGHRSCCSVSGRGVTFSSKGGMKYHKGNCLKLKRLLVHSDAYKNRTTNRQDIVLNFIGNSQFQVVNVLELRGLQNPKTALNPFNADPVKALHFAILV